MCAARIAGVLLFAALSCASRVGSQALDSLLADAFASGGARASAKHRATSGCGPVLTFFRCGRVPTRARVSGDSACRPPSYVRYAVRFFTSVPV